MDKNEIISKERLSYEEMKALQGVFIDINYRNKIEERNKVRKARHQNWLERKNKRKAKKRFGKIFGAISAIGIILGAGYVTYKEIENAELESEQRLFRNSSIESLIRYADISPRDGFVSEQENFNLCVLKLRMKGEGIIITENKRIIYPDGKEVPTEKLLQLLNDYTFYNEKKF